MSDQLHFIVADHDQESRDLIRKLLLQHYPQAEISETASTRQALELYQIRGARMVIVAHEAALMDGLQMVRTCAKAAPITAPLILTTNHPVLKQAALAAGAHSFANKAELLNGLAQTMAVKFC